MASSGALFCKIANQVKNNIREFTATLTEVEWTPKQRPLAAFITFEKMQLPRYNVKVQRWRMTWIAGIVV